MFNKLIFILVCVYFLQVTVFEIEVRKTESLFPEPADAKAIVERKILELLKESEQDKQKQVRDDIWTCTALKLGGNITPSIIYHKEAWRLLTSFFLHFNALHLIMNCLLIWFYSSKKSDFPNQFYIFSAFNILCSNITSSLIHPDMLKLGSSSLSVSLLAYSLYKNLEKSPDFSLFFDLLFLIVFIFQIFNKQIDNVVHLFGFINTIVYCFFKRKEMQKVYWTLCIGYLLLSGFVLFQTTLSEEQRVAVLINYGCYDD